MVFAKIIVKRRQGWVLCQCNKPFEDGHETNILFKKRYDERVLLGFKRQNSRVYLKCRTWKLFKWLHERQGRDYSRLLYESQKRTFKKAFQKRLQLNWLFRARNFVLGIFSRTSEIREIVCDESVWSCRISVRWLDKKLKKTTWRLGIVERLHLYLTTMEGSKGERKHHYSLRISQWMQSPGVALIKHMFEGELD